MLKKILEFKLKWMAKLVLRMHHPVIVGITGSVGKTTTKDAIALVLSAEYSVWKSESNYNNEIGMPLTILGAKTGKKNVFLWLGVFFRFFKLIISSKYPKVLVLEMGADRIGNIKYLTSIARPDIAVVTRVGEAHLEYFGDIETVQQEKSQLIASLNKEGVAILNADDPRALAMKSLHTGKTISFGLGPDADIQAGDIRLRQGMHQDFSHIAGDLGLEFSIYDGKKSWPAYVPQVLGNPQVYALLAAFAVGRTFGISREKIMQSIGGFRSPVGRLRPVQGIKRTVILDDTYNSSSEAVVEALKILKAIRARRRIVVLGDMLELGKSTESSHRRLGRLVCDLGLDMLVTVGERAKFIADEARKSGMAKSRILEFENADAAGIPLQNKMQEGDVVLIKGSQGIRLEKVVEEVMAEPGRAAELLVRQSADWKKLKK